MVVTVTWLVTVNSQVGSDSDTSSVSRLLESCDSDTSSVSEHLDSCDNDTDSFSCDSGCSHTPDRLNIVNQSLLYETLYEQLLGEKKRLRRHVANTRANQ